MANGLTKCLYSLEIIEGNDKRHMPRCHQMWVHKYS